MKILQLTNKIPYPPKDGGAIATLNISRGLANLGHQIDLLGMNTSKHYIDFNQLPEDLTKQVTFHEVKVNTGISIGDALTNLIFSSMPYNAVRFFNDNFTTTLIELLKKEQFDVIQLEGLYLTYYIDAIRRHSNALISFRAHNIEHEIWERTAKQEKTLFKRWYFNILARRIRSFEMSMINQYDLLIPITARDAAYFQFFGNTKPVHIAPAGFDISGSPVQHEKVKFPSVFFIGTLDWFPNQEGLLWFIEKVWPGLLNFHPNLVFNVAGRNAPEWLKRVFNKNDNIHFWGEIDDAYQFIHQNAIMIAPLFSGSGMRVKIIEGMALGKTIVTTSIGAEGINVSPGEDIIVEDDEYKFMLRIDELLRNRPLFEEMGKRAVGFVKDNYDNHQISLSLADFYQQHLKA